MSKCKVVSTSDSQFCYGGGWDEELATVSSASEVNKHLDGDCFVFCVSNGIAKPTEEEVAHNINSMLDNPFPM